MRRLLSYTGPRSEHWGGARIAEETGIRHGPFFENIFFEKFEKSLPFFEKFEKISKKNYFTNL
jgi:hypothetical protein